jgi:CheY-like chemotaxis protein
LKQVLLTLLTNAVKSAPLEGKIAISANPVSAGKMRIVVGDPGTGISGEAKPLDRQGAEQATVEGTGLGFALCHRLVQVMNGSIGVNTARENGSTFWVELACAEKSGLHAPPAKSNGSHPGSNGTGRTILYIEDNVSNITLIEQMLAEQPEITLITTMRGQLGIELARQHSPDLILLDLHLPDLPGWEVLTRLQRDETTREIPVVVISADVTSRQIKRLMAAGASAYLTKPFDMPEFLRIIEQTSAHRLIEAGAGSLSVG